LEDDNPIFRFNEVEKTLVQAQIVKLLNVGLVELSKGEYALVITMLANTYIFGNWIECHMCGDYCLVNKQTHLDKYAIPLLEENLNALGQAKVFNTLDLKFGYHQLPLKEGDKVKTSFQEIDPHGKDCLY
jgi:hypothetical protein